MKPSIHTSRLVIVVASATKTAALTQMEKIDPTGGSGALGIGLSATGQAPATHFWCSWVLPPDQATDLTGYLAGVGSAPNRPRIFDGTTVTPAQVLAETGLKRIEITGGA